MNELTPEEREVLARLELLAHGSTQRFDPTGGSDDSALPAGISTNGDGPPTRDYPHLHWKDLILNARDDHARSKALEGAQDELDGWRRRVVTETHLPTESWEQLAARIVKDGEGWPLRDVALHCRCSERQVIRARNEAGRNVTDGRGGSVGEHGSVASYKAGCKCPNCRAAWARQARDRRAA